MRAAPNPADRPVWPGTIGPSPGTPPRRPGSVRRTSTVDILFPDGVSVLRLRGHARDLVTRHDGATAVVDEATTDVRVDLKERTVTSIDVIPKEWQIAASELVGCPSGSRFRRSLERVMPGPVANGTVLGLLLDEVPVATLVAGASLGRRGLITVSAQRPRVAPLTGVCAGWIPDGAMARAIEDGETPFMGEGPPAPALQDTADPKGWHAVADLAEGAMRRWRRLDLCPSEEPGDPLTADVLFRDSYVEPDGSESVVHEYGVTAEISSVGAVRAIEAVPHVLPGPDCPIAAGSAQRLEGMALADVRRHVRDEFTGTSTCTHLNDALRSMGDLANLMQFVTNAPVLE
jgi:hypothetical protein